MNRLLGAIGAVLIAAATPATAPAADGAGDRVMAVSDVAVRAAAGPQARLLGTQRRGALGTVTGGPVTVAGTAWWQVDYEGVLDGWSPANQIASAYFPPPESAGGWRALVPAAAVPSAAQKANVRSKAGLDWDKLNAAHGYSHAASPSDAMLVIRNGWVAGEWGFRSAGRPGSNSKSLTGLTLAKLFDLAAAGALAQPIGPQTPVAALAPPEWSALDPRKNVITVDHLLTMTSGLAPDDRPYDPNYLGRILAQPVLVEPEQQWSYQSMTVDLLSVAMQRLTGTTVRDLFNTHIAAPIGIPAVDWDSFDGYTRASAGVRMTPRDLARVGYLMMMDGRWGTASGQAQIVSAENVGYLHRPPACAQPPAFAVTPNSAFVPDANANEYYGRLWWTNHRGLGLGVRVPPDAFFGIGLKENLLVVVPSLDLVVVRMGDAPTASGTFRRELMGKVMDAVLTPPPAYNGQRVASLTLMDNVTRTPIAACDPMPVDARIRLARLPTANLALRANTVPASVGSLVFRRDGPAAAQTATAGQATATWLFAPGRQPLTVIPYTQAGGTGTAGLPLRLTYTVE